MSLPARQLRKLEEIEGGLTGSDPRLRSLFSIFTRLTRGEAMPWFEEVPVRPIRDGLAAVRGGFRWIARRPAARVRALLLLPAALSALLCGIMIAGFTGAHRPSVSAKPPAARELILKTSRMCRLSVIRFPALAC
ncbi:MAG TPA: hypothetical protein VLW44_03190 [Streptosporangiaceae bacterium]|nr:hypothetical protein [Streptosporangiaceae bacterium]